MNRTFEFCTDPYCEGENLYAKATFTIEPGVTILVGCNGSGKTTLLHHFRETLERDKDTLVLFYNNLFDGGQNALAWHVFYGGSITTGATLATSSEGESIVVNVGDTARKIGALVRENAANNKPLFLLFDAVDSGLSVDNVVELKKYLFDTILKDCAGQRDVYIICSANEYELCNGENCFDVQNAEYIRFNNYDEYRAFVLQTRERKDAR